MNLNDTSFDLPVPDMPPTEGRAEEARRELAEIQANCDQLLSELASRAKAVVTACVLSGRSTLTECRARAEGMLLSQLDTATELTSGCRAKAHAALVNRSTQAFERANEVIGWEPKELAEVAVENAQGEFPTCWPNCPPEIRPPMPVDVVDPIGPVTPNILVLPGDPYGIWPSDPTQPIIINPPKPGGGGGDLGGGGGCQAPAPIIINPPACGPGGSGQPGPQGPMGPMGPPGPPGPPIIIGPTYPPYQDLSPNIEVHVEPPPPANVNVNITNVVNVPPSPTDPKPSGDGIKPLGIKDFVGTWNQVKCPLPPGPPNQGAIDNYFKFFQDETGFKVGKSANGQNFYEAPAGFFATDAGHELSAIEAAGWWASYLTGVVLPAVGATVAPKFAGCNFGLMAVTQVKKWAIELVEKWAGFDATNIKQPLTYEINYHCPSHLPGQGEVNSLYVNNWIDKDLWRCWTRANNNLDLPQEKIVKASYNRMSPSEAYRIQRLLPDIYPAAWRDALDYSGVASDQWRAWYELQQYIPSPSDLIRFMTRDVFDPNVVGPFNLDDEFKDKFQGSVKQWSDAQGLDDDKMKLFWRAHWQWPSPSQMYEMLHRWRADAPNRPANVAPVTIDDVKRVLAITDVAPIWRDRLAALSYKVVNRLELRRQYRNAIITKEGFVSGMQDLGYAKYAAESIADLFEYLNKQDKEKKSRTLSIGTISNLYATGAINRGQAAVKLGDMNFNDDEIVRILNDALFKTQANARKQQIANIKRRYGQGEFVLTQAVALLVAGGTETDQALTIVNSWDQTLKDKGKHASAAQLCKWLGQHLLTAEEYYDRLRRMGWPNEDAARIVQSCELDWIKKNTPKGSNPKPSP